MPTPSKTLEIRTSPHILSGYSVDTIMFNVVLALLPATGVRGLRLRARRAAHLDDGAALVRADRAPRLPRRGQAHHHRRLVGRRSPGCSTG